MAKSKAKVIGQALLQPYTNEKEKQKVFAAFRALPGRLQSQLVKQVGERLLENSNYYSEAIQCQFLEALGGVRWHCFDGTPFREVLDDELLSAIIESAGNHLVSINLRGCQKIDGDKVVRQLASSGSLRALDMREIESLTSIKGFFLQPTLIFTQLVHLEVSDCRALWEINIQLGSSFVIEVGIVLG